MEAVSVASQRMCADMDALGSECVPLLHAWGRVLRAPVQATRDHPPFRSAAMDGYALYRDDLALKSGLRIAGTSTAGARFSPTLARGSAVRIFTGAPVPDGADCVVPQENVRLEDGRLFATASAPDHIRNRGVDFRVGDTLVETGALLDGFTLAIAAAAGLGEVSVTKLPRIGVLATGTELATPGEIAGADQVYESVSFGVCALIRTWGGEPVRLSPQVDSIDDICGTAAEGLSQVDLLITIGGASVGDYDLVKTSLARIGLETLVPRVAVKPGKPTWFGRTTLGHVLGLPGNPAAALICAHLFLKPLLSKMLGRDPIASSPAVHARTAEALEANGHVERYMRARLESNEQGLLTVRPCKQQDTSVLSTFGLVNALIHRPADGAAVAAGEIVKVVALDRGRA